MNRDDIIRMARETGMELYGHGRDQTNFVFILCRFAALIEQHLSHDGIHTCNDQCQRPACVAVREAVTREREACAVTVEQAGIDGYGTLAAAAIIRAKGER
jgi:hypothetical protein